MVQLAHGARVRGSLLLVVTLVSVNLTARGAQQTSSSETAAWEQILTISPGSRVRLALRDGHDVSGRVVLVRADAVVLADVQTGRTGVSLRSGESLRDTLTFERSDIVSVDVLSRARDIVPLAGSFDQVSRLVGPGDKVMVTAASGSQFSGTITGVSRSALSMRVAGQLRELQESDVAAIRQRRDDSLANGARWGLGIGAAVGMVGCGRCHLGPGLMMAGIYGGIGAGIGVGIDALIRGNVTIYQSRGSARRITVAPQLTKSHKGVTVSIAF